MRRQVTLLQSSKNCPALLFGKANGSPRQTSLVVRYRSNASGVFQKNNRFKKTECVSKTRTVIQPGTCLVSGHDFSRAENTRVNKGF